MPTDQPMEGVTRRFGSRLQALLDDLGYPVPPAARARALSVSAGIDAGLAASYLNGKLLPDLPALLVLCDRFDREPGYFLDRTPQQVPPGTRLVRPLTPGDESLVIRLPSDFLPDDRREGPNELDYLRAPSGLAGTLERGDLIISARLFPWSSDDGFRIGGIYLRETASGYALSRCIVASETYAVHSLALGGDETVRPQTHKYTDEYAGLVLAQIKAGKVLRLSA